MLLKFSVKGFRNFKDTITMDFSDISGYKFSDDCINNGVITKALIYGKNAVGKTNLCAAMFTIVYLINGRKFRTNNIINADSDENISIFDYLFKIDDNYLRYMYSLSERGTLINESLYINNHKVFECDFINFKFDFLNLMNFIKTELPSTYIDQLNDLKNNEDEENDKQDYPFLRWIFTNYVLNDDTLFYKLRKDITFIRYIGNDSNNMLYFLNRNFANSLKNNDGLRKFETFLNEMGINCQLVLKKLPDDNYELYFKHKKMLLFFDNISSGTLSLVKLYQRLLLSEKEPTILLIDEFDAFYHYELAEKVLRYLKKYYPETQIILTTHNTNLMNNKLMRPDCVFILSSYGVITPLSRATDRELREGHNLQKMYISGEFDKYE